MNPRLLSIQRLLCTGGLLIASACCVPSAVWADDASKAAVIDELLTVTHRDTLMQRTLRQVLDTQRARLEQNEPFKSNKAMADEFVDRMTTLLSDKMNWSKLKPAVTKLYTDNFTEDELAAMVAFYKSPAGQAVLTKLPMGMADSVKIAQQKMDELRPEVSRLAREITEKYQKPKSTPASE